MRNQKVAAIIWTIDPEGKNRFLIRHNKPFDGYEDEWTICFGDIEENENIEQAAKRESFEEFGINDFEEFKNLDYKIDFNGKKGRTEINFTSLKVKDINLVVKLNEESIGYDWMLIEKVKEVMKHED